MYARGLQTLIFTKLLRGYGGAAETPDQLGDVDTESVLEAGQDQHAGIGGDGPSAAVADGVGAEVNQ
jgi:hypothetical protein